MKRTRHRAPSAVRARLARERAINAISECLMPMCTRPPIRNSDGRNLGMCSACAIDIAIHFERMQEEAPKLTEARLKRRLNDMAFAEKRDQAYEARLNHPGWIYYVRVGDRIKIGYSKDVKQRLRSYPPNSPLLAMHEGTLADEAALHAQFAGACVAGREWFHPSAEVESHIREMLKLHGEPDRFKYEYRSGRRTPVQVKTKSRRIA